MKKFQLWQAPLLSFFSTEFYRDLGQNWKGLGFLYLFIIALISGVSQAIPEYLSTKNQVDNGIIGVLIEQFPTISINDGKLSLVGEVPYYISDPDSGQSIICFDTGAQSNASPRDNNCLVLVTAEGLSIDSGTEDIQRISFKGMDHFEMNKTELAKYMAVAPVLLGVFRFLTASSLTTISSILAALTYSLVGLLICKMINIPLAYAGILRISSIALGTAIILDTIVKVTDVHIPFWYTGLWTLAIPAAYVMFGVGANLRQASFEPVHLENEGPAEKIE